MENKNLNDEPKSKPTKLFYLCLT